MSKILGHGAANLLCLVQFRKPVTVGQLLEQRSNIVLVTEDKTPWIRQPDIDMDSIYKSADGLLKIRLGTLVKEADRELLFWEPRHE